MVKKPASEKAAKDNPKPSGRNKYPAWGIRIPTLHRRLIKRAAKKNRRTETEETKIALEQYFATVGLWPPPDDDPPEEQDLT